MKRTLTIVSVMLGVYQLCNAVYANAKTMTDDAVNGRVEKVDGNLIYEMGDSYKDIKA
jgi:hypothetical protein